MNDIKIEARSRWGNTDAYREHEKKTKNYTKEKWAEINDGLMAIFAEFAERKNSGFAVNSPEMQSLVVKLQEYITQNYYTCTGEILAGLGQMYVADEPIIACYNGRREYDDIDGDNAWFDVFHDIA